ncbi:TerB family tellurite resistance protein [Rhodovibrionaceae bacterium A322]
MSIWGKILGGAAGFAMGGPIGALVGGLAGHAVDKMRGTTAEGEPDGTGASDATRSIAFTIGVIVLGAKMAKADGTVTKDEVAAFREVFQVPPDEMKNVGRIFNQARKDPYGYEPYARQLGKMFRDNPRVLEELLDGLFHIARADGSITPDEVEFLRAVTLEFGLSETDWDRIRAANMGPDAKDPYTILGVTASDDMEEIKKAHRKLVLEHHPDKLMAQGMPEEFIKIANEKLATINQAYDEIRKRRGV